MTEKEVFCVLTKGWPTAPTPPSRNTMYAIVRLKKIYVWNFSAVAFIPSAIGKDPRRSSHRSCR